MHHNRRARQQYDSFPRSTECSFCNSTEYSSQLVAEHQHCLIIRNRTFYTHWELRRVTDHLMLVPRRHVLSLRDLTAQEDAEIMNLLGEYEQQGYDIFARAPQSTSRSIPHQHTHLIKSEATPARGMFFLRRPYILKLFR